MSRLRRALDDERGSAVAEFTLVGVLLTVVALAVVQLALALHVRNTVLDAAAEGARYAALAGAGEQAGIVRTRDLIGTAISTEFAGDITASRTAIGGVPVVAITVRTTMPVIGLLGFARGLEVTGHAAVETLD
ncbi:TadE/TadG family type IV pilus assembly protein [Agromyces humatus]|uniref:TadE-like domain-containing protein n=1 Tax=Agromyces humatus TaxID=279573 RepID=A0ABN2KTL7_9MICO|nr:TadE/TadG family type IV pilus assembly protein [Agromyces humatus]